MTKTKGGQTKQGLLLLKMLPYILYSHLKKKKSINPFSSTYQIQGLEPILEGYFRGGYTLERSLVFCRAKKNAPKRFLLEYCSKDLVLPTFYTFS